MYAKFSTIILAGATLFSAACGAQAQQTLKWGHVFETSEPYHEAALEIAKEVEEKTEGRVKIEVYPASQLGKPSEIYQGLALGTVDIAMLTSSFAAQDYSRLGVTYYPFTFRNTDHLISYLGSDVYDSLVEGYGEKTGNKIAASIYYGSRDVSANKSVTKCADLEGVKMRVPDIPAYLAMPKACGANTAPIAFSEVYLALQNGTVEAQENPLTAIEAKKLYEVQSHIALTGHIVEQLNIIISANVWNGMSEEDQDTFVKVAEAAATRATDKVLAKEAELQQVFADRGLVIEQIDRADFEKAIAEKVDFDQFGYDKADWDAIRALN